MKKRLNIISGWIAIGIMVIIGVCFVSPVIAGNGLTMSPMYQSMVIDPGETQEASFRISNPSSATADMYYEISVEPFYVDEKGEITYQNKSEMNEIVDWIRIETPSEGKIEPNGVTEVIFAVDVPRSAPAGGQYFSVMVTETDIPATADGDGESSEKGQSTTIKEIYKMAHLVYVEVTGNVIKQGEINNVNVPSFFLSGGITGSASVKNTGNVHSYATYTMQVFPLFSDEEIYTNEESPEEVLILPDRTSYHMTTWEQTPEVGIFNVIYTVKFGDSMSQVKKMVIKCPLWLLFLIVFTIAAIVIYFVSRVRARKGMRGED